MIFWMEPASGLLCCALASMASMRLGRFADRCERLKVLLNDVVTDYAIACGLRSFSSARQWDVNQRELGNPFRSKTSPKKGSLLVASSIANWPFVFSRMSILAPMLQSSWAPICTHCMWAERNLRIYLEQDFVYVG